MVLSDTAILKAVQEGTIVIDPFDIECLGSNSYDVHLSKHLAVYEADTLDAAKHNTIRYFEIPADGYLLVPGKLYLGSTIEYTECHAHVPVLDGKSSTGRLGILIHLTAGRGDVGYSNFWTFELIVVHPVRVYAGMPIAQLVYHSVLGEVERLYTKKPNVKYVYQGRGPKPQESMMFKNKFKPNPEDYRGIPSEYAPKQPVQKTFFVG
jgi:dCTP deaminase